MNIREREIQREIMTWLEHRGIYFWRVPLSGVAHAGIRKRNPMAGHPDLAGILPHSKGRYFAIEIKTLTGKASEEQLEWIEKLTKAGCLAFIARSLEDVIKKFSEV